MLVKMWSKENLKYLTNVNDRDESNNRHGGVYKIKFFLHQ